MSSRQSLFYIAALLTGHVSAAGTTVGNGGFSSPSGIDEPKKTAPVMINDKPTMKSTPTVVEGKIEKVIERRLMPREEEQEVREIMERFEFEVGAAIDTKIYGQTVLHKIVLSDESDKDEMIQVILEKDLENKGDGLRPIIDV